MDLATTLVFYLLAGGGTAMAVYITSDDRSATRVFPLVTALLFWPLFLPLIATRGIEVEGAEASSSITRTPSDTERKLTMKIDQIERELDAALAGLADWPAGHVSVDECEIGNAKRAWRKQVEQICEIDVLLSESEIDTGDEGTSDGGAGIADVSENPAGNPEAFGDANLEDCRQSRSANLSRLRDVRHQMHSDLVGRLAWVRELITMIHLARYTGAPASRAEELLTQIGTTAGSITAPADDLADSERTNGEMVFV